MHNECRRWEIAELYATDVETSRLIGRGVLLGVVLAIVLRLTRNGEVGCDKALMSNNTFGGEKTICCSQSLKWTLVLNNSMNSTFWLLF